ncbi:hypothetical protein [Alteromonas flava]|uniref:hypothetical protein n=1 Tax=Alteromonas flava TaxID=2048003 RepID=UPI000C28D504|nr:hypothetical protein [Alteromonas flava]
MSDRRKEIFSLAYKNLAAHENQFGCISQAYYSEDGWVGIDTVYENFLSDFLCSAEYIYLYGYKASWFSKLSGENLPKWTDAFQSYVVKDGRKHYLEVSKANISDLKDYWIEPYIDYHFAKSLGISDVSPAKLIVNILPVNVPTKGLFSISDAFGQIGNPWAGGYQNVGKFVRERIASDSSLYLPYRKMSSFCFHGNEEAMCVLLDKLMEAGLSKDIEDFVPGYWDSYQVTADESIEQAASRLLVECGHINE